MTTKEEFVKEWTEVYDYLIRKIILLSGSLIFADKYYIDTDENGVSLIHKVRFYRKDCLAGIVNLTDIKKVE